MKVKKYIIILALFIVTILAFVISHNFALDSQNQIPAKNDTDSRLNSFEANSYTELVKHNNDVKVIFDSIGIRVYEDYVPQIALSDSIKKMDLSKAIFREGYNAGLNNINNFRTSFLKRILSRPVEELQLADLREQSHITILDTSNLAKCFYLECKDDFIIMNAKYFWSHYNSGYECGKNERIEKIKVLQSPYM